MATLVSREDFLPEVGDQLSLTIHFGKKDRDLLPTIAAIPRGRFSMVVKDAIRAYLKGENCSLPKPTSAQVQNQLRKTVNLGKSDYDLYRYLFTLDESLRSTTVKEILRIHLGSRSAVSRDPIKPSAPTAKVTPLDPKPLKLTPSPTASPSTVGADEAQSVLDTLLAGSSRYSKK